MQLESTTEAIMKSVYRAVHRWQTEEIPKSRSVEEDQRISYIYNAIVYQLADVQDDLKARKLERAYGRVLATRDIFDRLVNPPDYEERDR